MSRPATLAVQDARSRAPVAAHAIGIALLGYGRVGEAVARCAIDWSSPDRPLTILGALVRDAQRSGRREAGVDIVTDATRLFGRHPDVVVEALGGLEPARTLVRTALERRIPVVTANKALIARHGDELIEIASRTETPLRYEASVLAGVPFLGTFAARPYAARITRLMGIVNGTSNYILSRMRAGNIALPEALASAQALGYAEPDAREDIEGIDSANKLAVLTRHFGLGTVTHEDVEVSGIGELRGDDFLAARELGGTIKAVILAERTSSGLAAFVGPAFLPDYHKLATIEGVENALLIDAVPGRLFLSGPGAGPAATATTILDDVVEALSASAGPPRRGGAPVKLAAPLTRWFVRLPGTARARDGEIVRLLASYGVWARNTVVREHATWLLTYECSRPRIERALGALAASSGVRGSSIRLIDN